MELQEGDASPQTNEGKKNSFSIESLFLEAGLENGEVSNDIKGRMELLDELTNFVDDELRAIELSRAVFDFYKKTNNPFSETEKRTVRMGMLFSDIGKTGPRGATREQQQLVTEMFGVENVRKTEVPVSEFLRQYFPQDAGTRIIKFEKMGLDPTMPVRDFWNLHTLWTLEIIKGDGVPPEAVAAAATHQILENINPENIVGTDGRFTKYFGENTSFDRPEKLLILLDKYEAFRRRLGRTHEEAMARVAEIVSQNKRYAHDEEFAVLLKDMDAALGSQLD